MLGRADERGVDVRGLIWRSHMEKLNFSAAENRLLGRQLQSRGAEALLDMRVRTGGSHHQKLVVIRHRDDPERDIAYVGGIDLCHSRRDDAQPPRRPAGARDGLGVRRHPALARRDGGDHRAGGVRRRDRLPGAVGGPDPADPAPALLDPGQAPADGHDAGPAARAGAAATLAGGRHPHRPAAAHLPEPAPRTRLPVRPGRRAQRRARLHQGDRAGPAPRSTSRTSTSGASTSATCSPRRCAGTPTCT